MDAYLPFINGHTEICDELPLWIKPDKPLSVRDVMADMRDHYEGTALDMTADVSAGPWASPYRNQPVNYEAPDGTKMFRERPIGCQQSGMTMVCQMRSFLPDEVGGVTYFNMDDATMVAYVPVYCSINRVPEPFRRENNNIREFSFDSAFWMNNWVANMVYPRWSAMIGDLRDAQNELEDFYAADQPDVEKQVTNLTHQERVDFLTAKARRLPHRQNGSLHGQDDGPLGQARQVPDRQAQRPDHAALPERRHRPRPPHLPRLRPRLHRGRESADGRQVCEAVKGPFVSQHSKKHCKPCRKSDIARLAIIMLHR